MSLDSQQWQKLANYHLSLSEKLISPHIDPDLRAEIQRTYAQISRLLDVRKNISALEGEKKELQEQIKNERDTDLFELMKEELEQIEMRLLFEQKSLDNALYPADELDDRSVFLEIRAGAGGQEAALFASDLLRMYTLYAESKGWKPELVTAHETDLGGFREVVLHIVGKNVYGHLKYESGVHRVQRVPATEGSGRVHTSTATVAVLPEAEEVDININPADLRIDVYRSGGAGGQHVNTTDSAVRITHIPTGVVVTCQDERSQHKNKAKAMKVLQSRLLSAQKEKHDLEQSQKRKEQVGTGMRAEKVRTYNYPQNRISDHQVDLTLKKLDIIMQGSLDEIIDALREKDRVDRRRQSSLFEKLQQAA